MNNIDIKDETNITLLSMNSIYHSDLKSMEKKTFPNSYKYKNNIPDNIYINKRKKK